jgi:hypothetical protein
MACGWEGRFMSETPEPSHPQAGWYEDGTRRLRWWDGNQWTDRYAAGDDEPAALPRTDVSVPHEQPGWWERRREHHHEQELANAHSAWESQVGPARDMADLAHNWHGEPVSSDSGIIGKPGERAYLVLNGAGLIEPRRLPGHWVGHSQGVSIPIYKGIRYRVGATRGTYEQGEEVPTPIDTGIALISDQRVVFAGPKQTREWSYQKLIGFHHDPKLPWTALQVSNRQKVSGILYTEETELTVRFRLELAIADFQGRRELFAASVDLQLRDLLAEEPASSKSSQPTGVAEQTGTDPDVASLPPPDPSAALPTPTGANLPPAGWYPSPDGAGQRFWDGAAWTQQRD